MAEKESQHFVPQMYLRGFVNPTEESKDQNVLWLYEYNRMPRRRAPKSVGCEFRFYDLEEFEDPKEVENVLGDLEADAGPLLKRLGEGDGGFSPTERDRFAGFLALSLVRTPYFRDLSDHTVSEMHKEMVRKMLDTPNAIKGALDFLGKEEGTRITSESSLRKFMAGILDGKVKIAQTSKAWNVKSMFEMLLEYMTAFAGLRWVLLSPHTRGRMFITCDNPTVVQDLLPLGAGPRGYKPTRFFSFFFPVNRRYLLLGEMSNEPDTTGTISDEMLDRFYRLFVTRAYKQVYAPFRSTPLQAIVDKVHHNRKTLFPDLPAGSLDIEIPPEWLARP